MADLFQTSISGMLAAQRSLATTSHNISNVNTEGFSRQRVEYSTRTPQALGSGYIGTGVNVDTVRRMFDATRQAAVQTSTAEFGRLQTYADLSGRLDNLLADETAGLSPAMQNFFDSVQQVADDPSSGTARQMLLTEGENLVSRLNFLDRRFAEVDRDVDQRLTVQVGEINELAGAIAQMNKEIVTALGRVGQPPNDLLDKRDALVRDLSERIGAQVVEQEDGQYNVFIGNGQVLVNAGNANELTVAPSPYDPGRPQIAVGTAAGGSVDITNNLTGGSVGGMLDFRREVLDPARNDLGRIATSLATAFNQQHKLGASLEGAGLGAPFQTTETTGNVDSAYNLPVTEYPATAGNLQDSVYQLSYTAGTNTWTMTRLSDGASYTPAAGTITGDGFQVDVSSPPVDGGGTPVDAVFQIRPTVSAPEDFFDVASPQVLSRDSNTASGLPSAAIDPDALGELTGSDYELEYDGSAWSLTRLSDGQSFAVPASGQLDQDGLSIDVNSLYNVIPSVQAGSGNTATGSPAVTIDPALTASLTGSDYQLDYDGAAWSATRLSDGTVFNNLAVPVDGLVFDLSGVSGAVAGDSYTVQPGVPATGDSFRIRPTVLGASEIGVNLQRPSQVAAASALVSREATAANGGPANTGTGAIGPVRLSGDGGLANWSGEVRLTYQETLPPPASGSGYVVSGSAGYSGTIAYNPATQSAGMEVDLSAFGLEGTIELSGTPEQGDGFVIARNTSGLNGDNGNILELGALQEDAFLDNGTGTLQETYSGLVGDIGTSTMRAQVNRDAQEVMLNQAVAAREELSGVNLDEEAANLLKFQQAYQASAQAITIANSLFDSLLQAVRR